MLALIIFLLVFSANGVFSGQTVFAGYGFQIKEENLKWDDYEGLDVNDKWVMVMRHSPERENLTPYTNAILLCIKKCLWLETMEH